MAQEWGKVEKALPTVRMIPGENHRDRVLTSEEEAMYFAGAKSEAMNQHMDASLLSDVATIFLDCGLRPEECFRLRPENVQDGKIEIQYGKTDNARRRIPMTSRVKAVLEMRLSRANGSGWVFPAQTKSGHIEPSSLKKQRARACREKGVEPFDFYTLCHTWLTRWAERWIGWKVRKGGRVPKTWNQASLPKSSQSTDLEESGVARPERFELPTYWFEASLGHVKGHHPWPTILVFSYSCALAASVGVRRLFGWGAASGAATDSGGHFSRYE